MKNFKSWLAETSTNVSAGFGVRGLGDVSGQPTGDISNYAMSNSSEQEKLTNNTQQMIDDHNNIMNNDAIAGDVTDGNVPKVPTYRPAGGNRVPDIASAEDRTKDTILKAKKK
jgi:hypothetical protein